MVLNCPCIEGYYEKERVCLKCSERCVTCVGSADNCLSCLYGNSNGPPDCSCPEYLQLNTKTVECVNGWNVSLYTYFDQLNSEQYIRMQADHSIFGESRLLQEDLRQKIDLSVIDELKCTYTW